MRVVMTGFVLVYPDGSLAGVDYASGGYPYKTETLDSVKFWNKENVARDYQKSFPELTVKPFRFEVLD